MNDIKDTLAVVEGCILICWLFVSGRKALCRQVWESTLDNLPSLSR